MSKINIGIFAVLALLLVSSCNEPEPMDSCDTENMTYTNDIKEIFDASCAFSGCHGDAEVSTQGSLSNFENSVAFVDFGRIVGAINHDETFKPMPYPAGSSKISQCNIDKITAWIDAGTPE